MQIKLLHDLVEEMAGEGNGSIVEILFGKKNVNEFLIAKKLELTINQVRNILYKLNAENLVSFERKKDKRKGWYIYYWTLNTEKCLVKLEQSLIKKIDKLREILHKRETKRFYICKPCGIEVTEEKALDDGFSCEECAEIYELSDNTIPIRDTKAKITRTEKNLTLIQDELHTIREKARKKKERARKKAEKEAAEKKEMMRLARAAARKKIAEAKKKTEGKTTEKKKSPAKKTTTKKSTIKKKTPTKKITATKKPAAKKKITNKKTPTKKITTKKKPITKKKTPAKKATTKKIAKKTKSKK